MNDREGLGNGWGRSGEGGEGTGEGSCVVNEEWGEGGGGGFAGHVKVK